MPALPPYIIESIWRQFAALLPPREVDHPLGRHRPRVPDRVVFDKLVQVIVFGRAHRRIADESCSATTPRRRRDEWIGAGAMGALRELALASHDRLVGLELSDVAVDCCITKAPRGGERAGRSPVDRGKRGIKRSTVVDADGVPLAVVAAPANRHDSPLLAPTIDAPKALLGSSPPGSTSVHLDRGYDSDVTRRLLEDRGLLGVVREKGKPAPLRAGWRWVVERTNSWHNAHKKLAWCTERRGPVIDFWIAFSDAVIIVGRLVREGWTRYRWEDRPHRRP